MTQTELYALNNVLGRTYGTDGVEMRQLQTWLEANLRLGRPMSVFVNAHGEANCTSYTPDLTTGGST